MKNPALFLSILVCAGAATACPMADAVAKRYGISAFGFKTPIPAADEPRAGDDRGLVQVRLKDAPWISDGFRHTVVADPASGKAWILRTGGLAGVHQWYGPVEVDAPSIEHCRLDTGGEKTASACVRSLGARQATAESVAQWKQQVVDPYRTVAYRHPDGAPMQESDFLRALVEQRRGFIMTSTVTDGRREYMELTLLPPDSSGALADEQCKAVMQRAAAPWPRKG